MRNICVLLLLVCYFAPNIAKAQQPANTKEQFEEQYRQRITKERLNGVYIPKNLDDAFKQLDGLVSPEARKKLMSAPEELAARKLHFSFGRWMIVNWSFYEGSRLAYYLQSAGVTHPDDMADFMIIAYHRHLNKKDVNIKELATRMREKRQKMHEETTQKGEVIEETRVKKN